LTVRAVEAASLRIAAKRGNDCFVIPLSRLSEIETRGVVPSLYRLYSLAAIYRCQFRELLDWYGIDLNDIAGDMELASVPRTHRVESLNGIAAAEIPVRLDPSFDSALCAKHTYTHKTHTK
jgi:hypothetical protein